MRFLALIETQFSTNIKVLRSDSGREYMSNEFQNFLQSKWIISQRSCPSTPQQNSVAERKNHHLLDVVRTILLDSSIPSRFWCEALSTAIHLINRLLSPIRHEFGSTSFVSPSDLDPTPDPTPISTTLRRSTHFSQPPDWSKWVSSVKLRSDGSLDRYKARLIALGNKQEYGVDYEETFAPIAKMTTIYMKLPSSMANSSPHDVCKLKRSLYGLKQAPPAWFEKFRCTILDSCPLGVSADSCPAGAP
ncbi:Retrovirus-related Pol polyprotein from transposon TNT 1-94 [Vitis vinifera]|uniref:Retrovirus-related Pol polyprotein from transposon TNT 1-94 n=1 Tax=Vitis vinifera TaxID=29760 RepID=A0A438DPP6_VITVI|nr:Retrovirus-related Pol polyprotein from transposon TNT 1-94 [Vitis vinifera]